MIDTVQVMISPDGADALRELADHDDGSPDGLAYGLEPNGWAWARIPRDRLDEAKAIGATEIYF